ncbi:MAG: pyruvate carboxyltransferase [Deltaproteobacteria bacterium]|nr:MAG: pyruvate carboxyltransferase [Deltaproteobacteria bacterium]
MSLTYPTKVTLGDISVRDGLQHEERFIPTRAKLWLAEQLILAGFKRIEVTNFGNPRGMPQFADADEIMELLYTSKLVSHRIKDATTTAITIRERAVERAISSRQKGFGPDRILFMVSTSESHHRVNSGLSLADYWKMAEKYIQVAHDNGLKACGTVSTIWGCPIEGPTDMKKAVEFTRRWLNIGADDIEHADHDGSAPPNKVYDYYSMVLDAFPDPNLHVAHFHTTRGWGLANVLAALHAGITHFEGTLGGTGGQPANFVDGVPVSGTGSYYYKDPSITGLVSTEDMAVMMDEMGIDTGLDMDRVLEIGRTMEKILGRQLRSESVHTGRVPKEPTGVLE